MGTIAGKAHTMGYVVKCPIFFGVAKFKIFCSKECGKKWFADNVEPEIPDKELLRYSGVEVGQLKSYIEE